MLRSLYTGVAGLRNHQTMLDVTSHNISNVNTTGYKAQRVTLKEGFTQMLRGATRPAGDHGGVNPMQVGLGMAIGSIDSNMDQGSLESTGQLTDLAVEGRGFFAFSNGAGGTFYGRNGALQLNSQGFLVSPTNGYTLMGLMADGKGEIQPATVPSGIKVPFNEKAPASATTEIKFGCNLDADGVGLGTWQHTAAFLTLASGDTDGVAATTNSDKLTGLRDTNGNALGIQYRDVLEISYKDYSINPAGEEVKLEVSVGDVDSALTNPNDNNTVSTLEGLAQAIELALQRNGTETGRTVAVVDGHIEISGTEAQVENLVVKNTTRPTSNSFVANTFQWAGFVNPEALDAAGDPIVPAEWLDDTQSGRVLASVKDNTTFMRQNPLYPGPGEPEMLANIFSANGRTLGLENGDPINISGMIGANAITGVEPLVYNDGATGSGNTFADVTTMLDLMRFMQSALRLPDMVNSSSGQDEKSLEINEIDSATGLAKDPRAPLGSIIIRGQEGKSFAISGLSIHAANSNFTPDMPSLFNANMSTTEFQTARNTAVQATSIEVYDETGAPHTVTMTFTHSGEPGKWLWEITTGEGQRIIGGNRGSVSFGEDGSPANWVFDDGTTNFRFDPMNGSAAMAINLNVGHNGIFTGITQFRSASTTAATGQDGYPMGKLSEISISENGEINGLYTNGVNRMIARILIAEFTNPAGLMRAGDSMWAESNNSGEGTLFTPGEGTPSTIKPGALEMSNVDLASEFTDLITTQRGYQANARVISTSDQLLQELVQLVR